MKIQGRLMLGYLFCATTVILTTGCQLLSSVNNDRSVAATLSVTPQELYATDDRTLDITIQPELSLAPSQVSLPTPTFPKDNVRYSLILTGESTPNCLLPCWHGLRIGEATQSDVTSTLETLLQTSKEYDFFASPIEQNNFLERILATEEIYGGGAYWYFEDPQQARSGFYYLIAYMDRETKTLVEIHEYAGAFYLYDFPTLPQIITKLGTPDWIYVDSDAAAYILTLYYQQGIAAQLSIPKDPIDLEQAMVCFNHEPVITEISITAPYVNDSGNLVTHPYETWGPRGPRDPHPFIDNELDMSIAEFVDFIFSDDPCIEVAR